MILLISLRAGLETSFVGPGYEMAPQWPLWPLLALKGHLCLLAWHSSFNLSLCPSDVYSVLVVSHKGTWYLSHRVQWCALNCAVHILYDRPWRLSCKVWG